MNFEITFNFLGAEEPEKKKRGIQSICEYLESGKRIPQKHQKRLLKSLSDVKNCTNINVKRWFFKLVGLLGEENFLPYILGDVQTGALDQETTSWAVASISNLIPNEHELNLVQRSLDGLIGEDLFLLAVPYFKKRAISEEKCKKILESGNPIIGKWLCLHFGYNITPTPKHFIVEYNLHPDNYLSEFSFWALWKHEKGYFRDVKLPPQDIQRYPANIRRWYFMLMLKEEKNFSIYRDLIKDVITTDGSYSVRESIAKSIENICPDMELAKIVSVWFEKEQNEIVRQHLFNHINKHKNKHDTYMDRVNSLISGKMHILSPSCASKTTVCKIEQLRGDTMIIPRIETKKSIMTYFLGIDTVNFSSKKNGDQIQILNDILEMFRSISESHKITGPSGQTSIILTGDGLFLAIAGEENRFLPLKIAMEAQKRMNNLRSYNVRFGINSGIAYWVKLDDKSTQIIGHAINWTSRVLDAAGGDNSILISADYYNLVIKHTEEFDSYKFDEMDGLTTKKGEKIDAYRIVSK